MSHYENYTREFTKLSLWYARKRILEGSSDFDDAVEAGHHYAKVFLLDIVTPEHI